MDTTVAAYDKYAQTYDLGVAKFWEQFPPTTLDAFCSRLPGKKVLDLGSGSGQDALLLRQRGLEVTCLDAAPAMVAKTRELGFVSVESTFSEMQFSDVEFAGVWAYTSLIHIPPEEAKKVLDKLRQFLVSGGVLAVGVVIGARDGTITDNFMPGAARYIKDYQSAELKALVTKAGFTFVTETHYLPEDLMQVTDPDGTIRSYQEDYLTQIYTN